MENKLTWKLFADAVIIVLSVTLAAGLAISSARFRLWHSSKPLRGFQSLVGSLVYTLFAQFVLLMKVIDLYTEFNLVWVVLLLVVFNNYAATLNFSLHRVDRKHEVGLLENRQIAANLSFLWVLLSFQTKSHFIAPVYALWAMSCFKTLHRRMAFSDADKRYGHRNSEAAALYYLSTGGADHPGAYVVTGDETVKVDEATRGASAGAITTVGDVLRCEEWLLRDRPELQDLCISFALFKLLKIQFATKPVHHRRGIALMELTGVLYGGDVPVEKRAERAFRIVSTELIFLLDYLYARAIPITYGLRSLLPYALVVGFVVLSLFAAVTTARTTKRRGTDSSGNAVTPYDCALTEMLAAVLLISELTQFAMYIFSDWAKVHVLAACAKGRLRRQWQQKLVLFLYGRHFPKTLRRRLPQYSLLKNAAAATSACGGKRKKKAPKMDGTCLIDQEMKTAVFCALERLLRGEPPALERLRVPPALRRPLLAVEEVMMWHIATSYCNMASDETAGDDGAGGRGGARRVANGLSKYCAYLAAAAPELITDNVFQNDGVLKLILGETREQLAGAANTKEMLERMLDAGADTVLRKGVDLADRLVQSAEEPWAVLGEVWAELLLKLAAASDNKNAHEKSLAEGGELITLVRAMLYHATPTAVAGEGPGTPLPVETA